MNIIINSKKMSMKISDEPTSLGRLDFSELVSANSGGNNSRDSSASTEGVSAMKELKNRKNNKHKKTTDFLSFSHFFQMFSICQSIGDTPFFSRNAFA